ncbi:Dihydrofolate reductase [Geodermatophilus africanus]|uniref:Dihydrofolate reductase n=1 Tax=Geodermatophilus africanus TaxID=1137993 RepID=A0A1H3KET2_9ACTN|nr:dihydrofolate reductase family protein [Geodermatophilus africanus]SDY50118.1 Dihydrofolate reductase [Geodermatophilus africanus]
MSSVIVAGQDHMSVGTQAIRLDMTMSLDGFVVGPQDSTEEPMGTGGFRLFNWLDHRHDPGPNGQVFAEATATRAVISGRRTYEHANRWQGDHHDGVPVFVLTHRVPEEPPPGSVQYVTDVRTCAESARAAAGDADVLVLGAGAAQALLRAGELDEMELHVVPVLLGRGRRLFDHLPAEPTELELTRELNAADADPVHRVLHLRYRVQRPPPTQDAGDNR